MRQHDIDAIAAAAAAHRPTVGWTAQANCAHVPLDEFFADDPTETARQLCRSCPVKLDCLVAEVGIPSEDIHGYRAGLAVGVRRRVLRAVAKLVGSQRDARICRAQRAVAAGATVSDVAAAIGVTRRTVHRWIRAA